MGKRALYLWVTAITVAIAECSLDDNREELDYMGSSIEDQHFDDLTMEPDPHAEQHTLLPVSHPVLQPPPLLSPTAEDITLITTTAVKSVEEEATTVSQFTILTVARVLSDGDNITDSEPLEAPEKSVTLPVRKPARIETTLLDEVVTFAPPSGPPIFTTIVHAWAGTPRPALSTLNDGDVQHKANVLRKKMKKKKTGAKKNKNFKLKKEFDAPKRLRRVKGTRNLVSRDVGPPGRKIPLPKGWRITQL